MNRRSKKAVKHEFLGPRGLRKVSPMTTQDIPRSEVQCHRRQLVQGCLFLECNNACQNMSKGPNTSDHFLGNLEHDEHGSGICFMDLDAFGCIWMHLDAFGC